MQRTTVSPATLLKRERQLLDREGIPGRWVLDATDLRAWSLAHCRSTMTESSTCLAVGFRRCDRGHRLMNSRGKCVQCDPGLLRQTRRWTQRGFVYLAVSRSMKLVKLGSCQDLEERQRTLRDHTWAGASDWRLRDHHCTIAAGMFEHDVSKRLARFQVITPYNRYGRNTYTREVYNCCFRTAKKHFEAEIGGSFAHYWNIAIQCEEEC